MAKKKMSKSDITYVVTEHIGILSESDSSDWCKAVAKISWNDRPATIDIRRMNMSNTDINPKGISLTDEEVDTMIDLLLERDYGSMEALSEAINRRRSRFTIGSNSDEPIQISSQTLDIRINKKTGLLEG